MRENHIQTGIKGTDNRLHIDGDWYGHGIPSSIQIADDVYIDTSYGFAAFQSVDPDGMFIGQASGCYDRASFIVSKKGKIKVGKFSILNGTTIISKESITIGDHCMLAWGSVLSDSWFDAVLHSMEVRRAVLHAVGNDRNRPYPFFGAAAPIVLEDNCWVGFDAVILPGVRLGRGCVVACKTVVSEDVPPYAVVAGSPARIVKYLLADDTEEVKKKSFQKHLKINFLK